MAEGLAPSEVGFWDSGLGRPTKRSTNEPYYCADPKKDLSPDGDGQRRIGKQGTAVAAGSES